jgi:hypothetical protein
VDEPPIRELPDLVSELAAVVVWVRPHRVVVCNNPIMAEVFGGLDQATEGAVCGIVERPDLRLVVPVITEPEPTHGASLPDERQDVIRDEANAPGRIRLLFVSCHLSVNVFVLCARI